ncbi:alpha/beta-hydrolase [Macrolepiota fuliginosa MF-IS2]|uniref:Alpha/beta-hydrolase n=1 Tax=Macrolepiota fuliginosa MF-IS2 TaxID=1400762 RepID=A0A9P5XEU7_9AGAR|nr:alpha/beta-hydrolase [Macrolepiota fuliginosa MF-IS2]
MYTCLAEIPVPLSATFIDPDVVQIAYSVRNHLSNTKKTLTKIIPLAASVTGLPLQEVGEVVAHTVSPSFKFRANLRESKQGTSTKRFVEIWSGDRAYVSFEVTDYHQAFYLDEYLSTLIFSPSETALLYTAEANAPHVTPDDPYAKYRYRPSFGEGFGGKKRPHFFLLRWSSPTTPDPPAPKPTLYEIHPENDDLLFGQGIFFPTPEETTIYATGYEFTPNGRLLGIKGCYNRPFGVWELHFQKQTDDDHDNSDEKKHDLIIYSARKISDTNSGRSPRILQEDSRSILYWLSSNAGGPHISTASLQALDITSLDAISPEIASRTRTVLSAPKVKGSDFPGLYPPFNLPTRAFLQPEYGPAELITQSQWGSRTVILSISPSTGAIKNLTPPDPGQSSESLCGIVHNAHTGLFSWALLATDGKNRIICSRSSPAIPYQIYLGTFSEKGLRWSMLDQPDLAPDVYSALGSIHTSIHPIPDRHPTETIVIRSVLPNDLRGKNVPLVTVPHGGPHAATTTAFSPATTALVLEGYTLSLPNYTGTPGYGQDEVSKLLGQCGTLDVEDVHASTLHVVNDLQLAQFGQGDIFVMGGSHGGFIAAHLISRYPNIYSAAILRNPVITCGEVSGTDIPDWYFAEFGFQDDFPIHSSPPFSDLSTAMKSPTIPHFDAAPHVTPRIFEGLYEASPSTALVNRLKNRSQQPNRSRHIPPVLLLIGTSDQRVSPTQGTGLYHLLKGAGEEVEMLVFDGEGHPLDGVEAAKVGWEAGRDWLKKYGREEEL